MRAAALRFGLFVAIVVVGAIAAYRLGLVDWLTDGSLQARILSLRGLWWTPWALLGLFVVTGCLPLPATAVVLTAGAVYGPFAGYGFNLLGCLLASSAGYGLARALGRDFVVRLLGERSVKIEGLVEQHGFWTMVRARMMMPLAVVNYGGALGGMRLLPYLASSMLGMAVPLALYTYVGHLLGSAGGDPARMLGNVALAVIVLVAVSLIPPLLRRWKRRRGA